jgi:hypothetical protein
VKIWLRSVVALRLEQICTHAASLSFRTLHLALELVEIVLFFINVSGCQLKSSQRALLLDHDWLVLPSLVTEPGCR